MKWHYENRIEPRVLCHPSDGEAWKPFEKMYPKFATEPINVMSALCSDGISPFNNSTPPYSYWSIIVTPYNLPPELCMTTPFMFLTLIIPLILMYILVLSMNKFFFLLMQKKFSICPPDHRWQEKFLK